MRLAEAHGTDAGIVAAQIANSAHRKNWAAEAVHRLGLATARMAVWGLAYKEDTHSVKNSPSLHTLALLPEARVTAHDPAVAAADVPAGIGRADDPLAVLDGAEALLVLTPWPAYRGIAPADIAARLSGKVVLDPYRVLDGGAIRDMGLSYMTLGVGDA